MSSELNKLRSNSISFESHFHKAMKRTEHESPSLLSSRISSHEHVHIQKQMSLETHMGVSKNRGNPKWMVYFMVPNPIKMDDLGGPPLFLETHIDIQTLVSKSPVPFPPA